MNELTSLLWQSTLETLYMVAVAALFSACGGLALGLLLVLTRPNGILAAKWLNRFLETITNMARSVKFIILLVVISHSRDLSLCKRFSFQKPSGAQI